MQYEEAVYSGEERKNHSLLFSGRELDILHPDSDVQWERELLSEKTLGAGGIGKLTPHMADGVLAGIRNGAENAHRGGSKNASGRKIKKKCREFIVFLRYNRGYTNQI